MSFSFVLLALNTYWQSQDIEMSRVQWSRLELSRKDTLKNDLNFSLFMGN